MQFENVLKEVTKENILLYVSEIQIFENYMDKPTFDKAFSSPFRKDNNPSFIVKRSRAYYKDYATGEFGDCFSFVKKLYKVNYNDALIQVVTDMGLKQHFNIPDTSKALRKKAKVTNALKGKTYSGNFNLKIKSRLWAKRDTDYWGSYGISIETCMFGKVIPISHYFINDRPFVADTYAYAYGEYKDNVWTYKVYQPFSKYKKWINGNDYSTWELWVQVTKFKNPEALFITSSRKDALAIMHNFKMPALALQAETIHPKPHVMRQLLERAREGDFSVFLLFDNDFKSEKNWGQLAAYKLIRDYPWLNNVVIPEEYGAKDFSDLIFYHGVDKAKKILIEAL